jgi:glycosyltransferase involved in cell wall biosynthesis
MSIAAPSVSVVIPARNARPLVADAIQSALTQTYQPLECIVIDDGSTDSTGQWVRDRFGRRVELVRQPNRGVAAARNAGCRVAQGDLIAFLDADDVWLREKLERQIRMFEADPDLDFVYSSVLHVDRKLRVISVGEAAPPSEVLRRTVMLDRSVTNLAMTGVVRTRRVRELGGFDERLSTSADADLACRLALHARIDCVSDALALYRQHPGQMHSDLVALEHDMQVIIGKLFGNGSTMKVPRRRSAMAALHRTLAIAYLHDRSLRRGMSHAVKSLLLDPRVALRV